MSTEGQAVAPIATGRFSPDYLPVVTFLPFKCFYQAVSLASYASDEAGHLPVQVDDLLVLSGCDLNAQHFFAGNETTKRQGWVPRWIFEYIDRRHPRSAPGLPITSAQPLLPSHLPMSFARLPESREGPTSERDPRFTQQLPSQGPQFIQQDQPIGISAPPPSISSCSSDTTSPSRQNLASMTTPTFTSSRSFDGQSSSTRSRTGSPTRSSFDLGSSAVKPGPEWQIPGQRSIESTWPPVAAPVASQSAEPDFVVTSSPSRRKVWDQAYEQKRKLSGKRGHGMNLDYAQQPRFPPSVPGATYGDFIERLLRQLSALRTDNGRIEYTDDAIRKAKERLARHKAENTTGRGPWRVWLPDHVWNLFQFLKSIALSASATQAEFVELLLDLNGRTAGSDSETLQLDLLTASSRAAQECLHDPNFMLKPDPEEQPDLKHLFHTKMGVDQDASTGAMRHRQRHERIKPGLDAQEGQMTGPSTGEGADPEILKLLETMDESGVAALRFEAASYMADEGIGAPRKRKQRQTEETIRSNDLDLEQMIRDLCPIDQQAFMQAAIPSDLPRPERGEVARGDRQTRLERPADPPSPPLLPPGHFIPDDKFLEAQDMWEESYNPLVSTDYMCASEEFSNQPAGTCFPTQALINVIKKKLQPSDWEQIFQILLAPFWQRKSHSVFQEQGILVFRTTAMLSWLHHEQFFDDFQLGTNIGHLIKQAANEVDEDEELPYPIRQLIRNLAGLHIVDVQRVIDICGASEEHRKSPETPDIRDKESMSRPSFSPRQRSIVGGDTTPPPKIKANLDPPTRHDRTPA
ncbi:hypothetical protein HKX48_007911 [Thoreauomyces humboldtii]|nr:hypothetical protein HKX48_007911 [Thoreauomyces humboldtii]